MTKLSSGIGRNWQRSFPLSFSHLPSTLVPYHLFFSLSIFLLYSASSSNSNEFTSDSWLLFYSHRPLHFGSARCPSLYDFFKSLRLLRRQQRSKALHSKLFETFISKPTGEIVATLIACSANILAEVVPRPGADGTSVGGKETMRDGDYTMNKSISSA